MRACIYILVQYASVLVAVQATEREATRSLLMSIVDMIGCSSQLYLKGTHKLKSHDYMIVGHAHTLTSAHTKTHTSEYYLFLCFWLALLYMFLCQPHFAWSAASGWSRMMWPGVCWGPNCSSPSIPKVSILWRYIVYVLTFCLCIWDLELNHFMGYASDIYTSLG